jgi:ABC-type uncharacterized transport system auxiliary subunit
MKIKPLMFACVSVAALLTTSCGKVRYPNYYTLSLAPTMTHRDNGGRRLGSVRVRDFETPPYLRQGRIVYRESPTQVGYYDHHRWVTNPGATVTAAIISGLRSSGLFSEVDSDASHMKTDFLLTGQLERLDEIDYGGGVRVEVKLSAQLVDLRSKATVWSGDEAETATVEKANAKKGSVNLVVRDEPRGTEVHRSTAG